MLAGMYRRSHGVIARPEVGCRQRATSCIVEIMAISLPPILEPERTEPERTAEPLSGLRGEELRLRDGHGRAMTDLRLSVTDRCN